MQSGELEQQLHYYSPVTLGELFMLAIIHCYVGDWFLDRGSIRQSNAFVVGKLFELGNTVISHPHHHKVVCNTLRPPFHRLDTEQQKVGAQ